MDEKKADHLRSVPPSLTAAIRRARIEGAEQNQAVAELREAEVGRLQLLEEAIRPVIAQAPEGVDLFDVGLAYGERPRLFIDMIGFVEMAHDRRTYRFVQDTRHGRVVLAESERMEPIVDAVTDYIARRLIEREKALAADGTLEQAARTYAEAQEKIAARRRPQATAEEATPPHGPFSRFFAFLIEILGSALLFAFVALGAFTAWKYLAALSLAKHGGG
jgi:hypothetical protein